MFNIAREVTLSILYLVRHGQTDWNAAGRLQGHADRPLDGTGLAQAAAIGARLSSLPLDAVYASDLERARATAREIAARQGLVVTADARLREFSYGAWEGRAMAELAVSQPVAVAEWRRDPGGYVPHGGESEAAVQRRLGAFLQDLCSREPGEQIAIVTHGRALRTLLSLLLPGARDWASEPVVETASLTVVGLAPEGARLLLYNDTAHLELSALQGLRNATAGGRAEPL